MKLRSTMRKVTAGVAALGLSVALVSCASDDADTTDSTSEETTSAAETSSDSDASFPRTIETVDGEGNATEVTIESQPERIVSTSVTLTGSLLSMDAPVIATGGASIGTPISDDKGLFRQWADVADERGVEALYSLEPNVEAILAQDPDLIVMSSAGADSATDIYGQLEGVAPIVVVDYSNQNWQEVTRELAEITGHEDEAEEVIADYDARVAEVSEKINLPEQPVNVLSYLEDGGANVWTEQSAQGQVFSDLGWEVAQPAEDAVDSGSTFANRTDTRPLSAENLGVGLTGNTLFVLNVDTEGDLADEVLNNPTLTEQPAVVSESVYNLPPTVFRIDYYSANILLDTIEEYFS